jgi:hypothetical protein
MCASIGEKMLLKRRVYVWMGIVAVAVITALLTLEYLSAETSSGVAYNGKSLEYWLSQTPMTWVMTNGSYARAETMSISGHIYGSTLEKSDDVDRAFLVMGTNCLPFLIKKLGVHQSRIAAAVERLTYRLKIKRIPRVINSWDKLIERAQAVTALKSMESLPDETYEQIRALSKSSDPEIARSAKHVLDMSHKTSDEKSRMP